MPLQGVCKLSILAIGGGIQSVRAVADALAAVDVDEVDEPDPIEQVVLAMLVDCASFEFGQLLSDA